jgi:hypothetical protein
MVSANSDHRRYGTRRPVRRARRRPFICWPRTWCLDCYGRSVVTTKNPAGLACQVCTDCGWTSYDMRPLVHYVLTIRRK